MAIWKELSIKRQFFTLGLFFFLTLVILLLAVNMYMVWQTDRNHRDFMTSTIDQMNIRLSVHADQLNRLIMSLAYDPLVQEYLDSQTPQEWFENHLVLTRRLSQAVDMTEGIHSLIVRPIKGSPVIGAKQVSMHDIANLAEPPGNTVHFTGVHELLNLNVAELVSSELFPNHVVALRSYSILPHARINTHVGTIFMLIDGQKMDRAIGISSNDDDTAYYILDMNDRIVYSNQAKAGHIFDKFDRSLLEHEKVELIEIDNQHFYACQRYNPNINMYLLTLTPAQIVFRQINQIIYLELLVISILIILAFVILVFFKRSAVQPLLRMSAYFNQVRENRVKVSEPLFLDQNQEASQLANQFNQMLRTLDQLNQQLLDAELYKKQSEIALLHNQINPHFLYNTLETIKGMAYIRNCSDVADMVSYLGRVFRYSVKAPEFVRLHQEINMLKDYLAIQHIRFDNRFEVDLSIDAAVESARIPKMLLQPIVENAVQHGLEVKKEGGLLQIKASEEAGNLLITISDNGSGISLQDLRNMQAEMESASSQPGNQDVVKIGITNVHGRIRHYYGKPYGLTIQSQEGEGVSVSLRLPLDVNEHV